VEQRHFIPASALIADPSTKLVFTGVIGTVELAFGSR